MERHRFDFQNRFDGDCSLLVYENRSKDYDLSVSNSLYDQNKMVTHAIVHHPDPDIKLERVVSDVELAMSDSPEVNALMSSEYKRMLQLSLQNQQRSPVRDRPLSDDDLLKFSDLGNYPERCELDSVIRDKQNAFYSHAVDKVYSEMVESSIVESSKPE